MGVKATKDTPNITADDGTAGRHTTAILAIILISYFMILLDNSVIFTALAARLLPQRADRCGDGPARPALPARDGPPARTIRPDRCRLYHPRRRSAGLRHHPRRRRELDVSAHRGRAGRRSGAGGGGVGGRGTPSSYFSTQYLQGVLGFSASRPGGVLPDDVVNFAVAMTIPRVTARLGQAIPSD